MYRVKTEEELNKFYAGFTSPDIQKWIERTRPICGRPISQGLKEYLLDEEDITDKPLPEPELEF